MCVLEERNGVTYRKYNYKTGLHPSRTNFGIVKLTYSKHAIKRAKERGIHYPLILDTENAKVVEMKLVEGKCIDITYRIKYVRNSSLDLYLVVCPTIYEVKTLWTREVGKPATVIGGRR